MLNKFLCHVQYTAFNKELNVTTMIFNIRTRLVYNWFNCDEVFSTDICHIQYFHTSILFADCLMPQISYIYCIFLFGKANQTPARRFLGFCFFSISNTKCHHCLYRFYSISFPSKRNMVNLRRGKWCKSFSCMQYMSQMWISTLAHPYIGLALEFVVMQHSAVSNHMVKLIEAHMIWF